MSSQIYEGQIPDGWYVATLGEICEISAGGDLGRLTFSHIKTDKFLNPIYSNAVSNNGLYGYSSDFDFEGNFVTVTARGYIGYAVARSGKFCSIGRLLNLKPKFDISCYYVAEYINQFIYFVIESTGVPQLTVPQISKYKILMPKDKAEQERIAQVLGDMDELIRAKCKLLDKKRAIKQAAAQQLLTPKPHWHTTALGEIGKTYSGLSGKNKEDFGTGNSFYIPFTNIMSNIEIDINNLEIVKISDDEKQNLVMQNDLLFNGSSETPEEVCFCSLANFEIPNVYLNSFCFGFRIQKNKSIFPKFFAYWFRSDFGRNAISFMAQGSTRYNISKSEFLKFGILMPNLSEQTKIAEILSDMDGEISALQDEIEKLKMIKQGAMDELLSGKIRLKG
ncbi:MAG: restriction endonuclease subunit S [Campylobacter concisus]